ncbi:hypothetical protein HDU84_007997 [Entophlyctis sp. JEL0112]|nr:hypothetical protein HDU84_007997 [Entophlyctis sp. JEL0112]
MTNSSSSSTRTRTRAAAVQVVGSKIRPARAAAAAMDDAAARHAACGQGLVRTRRPPDKRAGGNTRLPNACSASCSIPRPAPPAAARRDAPATPPPPPPPPPVLRASRCATDREASALKHLLMRFGDVEPWNATADALAELRLSGDDGTNAFPGRTRLLRAARRNRPKLKRHHAELALLPQNLARGNRRNQNATMERFAGSDALPSSGSSGIFLVKLRSPALGSDWDSMSQRLSASRRNSFALSTARTAVSAKHGVDTILSRTLNTGTVSKLPLQSKCVPPAAFKPQRTLFPPLRFPQTKWTTSQSINPKVPILDGIAVSTASRIEFRKRETKYQLKQVCDILTVRTLCQIDTLQNNVFQKLLLGKSNCQKSVGNSNKTKEAAPEVTFLPQIKVARQQPPKKPPKSEVPTGAEDDTGPESGISVAIMCSRREPHDSSLRPPQPRHSTMTLPLLHEPLYPLHRGSDKLRKTQRKKREAHTPESLECKAFVAGKGQSLRPTDFVDKASKGCCDTTGEPKILGIISGSVVAGGGYAVLEPITGTGFRHVQSQRP